MAAIPDTGGARRAHCGVSRALLRVVVLGGLVVAGWLLGSGIGQADEDLEQPGTDLIRLVEAAPSDGASVSRLGVPPAMGSTVKKVLSAAPIQRLPVPPSAKAGVLKPLAPVLAPVTRPLSGLSPPAPAIQLGAPVDQPAAVPPAAPVVRVAVATAPVPAPGPTAVPTMVGTAPPAVGACAAAHPAADPLAELPALGNEPADPVPVPMSPPGTATAACLLGSSGGGISTKSTPDVAVTDSWAMAGLASMHRLLSLGADDFPRSPAGQPSTSPD
ncbi:MAG: hypothetical protein M3460_03385 [Actinomycetota bacterium]|nr:hypothetical protein [Actinomycetota bacterium]